MRQALQRADASVLGVVDDDPANLALTASVTASSTLTRPAVEVSVRDVAADHRYRDGRCRSTAWTASNCWSTPPAASLTVELHDPVQAAELPAARRSSTRALSTSPAGEKRWVHVPLSWQPDQPRNAIVVLRKNAGDLRPHGRDRAARDDLLRPSRPGAGRAVDRAVPLRGNTSCRAAGLCLRLGRDRGVRAHERRRRLRPPVRRPATSGPPKTSPGTPTPWIELAWPTPVEISEIVVILDDDVEEDLINLHHHRTPFEIPPHPPRRPTPSKPAIGTSDWHPIATITANHHRTHRHPLYPHPHHPPPPNSPLHQRRPPSPRGLPPRLRAPDAVRSSIRGCSWASLGRRLSADPGALEPDVLDKLLVEAALGAHGAFRVRYRGRAQLGATLPEWRSLGGHRWFWLSAGSCPSHRRPA